MKPSETRIAQNQDGSANAGDKNRWRREVTEFLSQFRGELDQLTTDLEIEHAFRAECADRNR